MAPDERVEAAARAMWRHATRDVTGRIDEPSCIRLARRALTAAGLDDLEAENARLREEVERADEHLLHLIRHAVTERDAARRELADLRAGVDGLAADGEAWGKGVAVDLSRRLRALLAAAPSEPAPEARAVAVSAEQYEGALYDASVRGCAEDAGCDPGDLLDYVISALGITVTKEADRAE